jgi:ribosomal protein S18 acetylase RimI-like enzyme
LIRIRRGAAADVPALHAVERSAGERFRGTHMAWAVGEVTDAADLLAGAEAELLWVAEAEDGVCGFLLAEGIGRDFHIWELSVDQRHQGQGVGRDLLEAALGEAARRGFERATLTTDRTLAWNAPWYARRGFHEVSGGELDPRLTAQMKSEPEPARRCAMARALAGDA